MRCSSAQSAIATAGGRRVSSRKRALAFAVGLAVLATVISVQGALPQEAPEPYPGRYVLFYNRSFAGPISGVSGCVTEFPIQTFQESTPTGPVSRIGPGNPRFLPCHIDVGLNMSSSFRSAVTTALNGTPTVADVAIARLDESGTQVVDEINFRGYISDVTLPALRPAPPTTTREELERLPATLLRVELVSSDGTATTVMNPPARALGAIQQESFSFESSRVLFNGVGEDIPGIDALRFTRQDNFSAGSTAGSRWTPGLLTVSPLELRVSERLAVTLRRSIDAGVGGERLPRFDIAIFYGGFTEPTFQLTLNGFPSYVDPFPRSDNHHLARYNHYIARFGVNLLKAVW